MHDVLLLCAAACYLGAVIVLFRSLASDGGKRSRTSAVVLALIGVVLHGAAQYLHWPADLSVINVLSLCALVVVAMLLASLMFRKDVFDAGLVALPLAIVVLLTEWLTPGSGTLLTGSNTGTSVHVVSSIMAFGVLSIAGVYALFVALIDHFLRHHHLNRLVRALPALDVLEDLLFRLIAVGFILLTISLLSGFMYVNDIFAQHLVHKSVLSIAAWVLFGLLLWGRHFRGWRGRTAVRLTIAGVVILVLAYFGSKWVLEVLLDRSWQN